MISPVSGCLLWSNAERKGGRRGGGGGGGGRGRKERKERREEGGGGGREGRHQQEEDKDKEEEVKSRVCILPVDSNLHSLFLGSLESYAGGISLSRFRCRDRAALYNIISTFLAKVMIVEQCTIQIIPDAECGIFAVPARGLPHTISCGHGSLL